MKQQNKELSIKYENGGDFQGKMEAVSLRFRQYEQLAIYTEPSEPSKHMIIPIKIEEDAKWMCSKSERVDLQVVLGMKQQAGSKSIEFLLRTIVFFVPRPTRPYSIIYINTLADVNAYSDFKKIQQFLPIEYFKHLHQILVLQASFKEKAFDLISFDYLTNFIKSKTIHLSTFERLIEYTNINGQKLLQVLPKILVMELAKGEKIVKKHMESSRLKAETIKKNIQQYEVGHTGAPIIIQLLILYFQGKENYLTVEGLFRKSANIEEESMLLKELEKQNFNCLEAVNDPHLIANAIKRFLSNLASPLIPYRDFEFLMESDADSLINNVKKVINSLNICRKMTILHLFGFFRQKLLPKSSHNLMTDFSISIVIGPCIMRSEVASMKDLLYAQKIIKVVIVILNNFQDIFGNKEKINEIIRQSVLFQQSESLKERLGELELKIEIQPHHQPIVFSMPMQPNILTQEQQFGLDQADDFLSAFNKKP